MKIDWNEAPYWAYCVAEREGKYHWLGVDSVQAFGGHVIPRINDNELSYTVIEDRPINWNGAPDWAKYAGIAWNSKAGIWYDDKHYCYMEHVNNLYEFGVGVGFKRDSVIHHGYRALAPAVIAAPAQVENSAAPVIPAPVPVPAQVENSGGSCDYYRVFIEKPTTAGESYTAECNDVIEALNMTYAESNMFKEIWRTAAARTLGKRKAGHDEKRGAEKIVFFAKRHAIKHGVK